MQLIVKLAPQDDKSLHRVILSEAPVDKSLGMIIAPWPACPDILYTSSNRTCVGITYRVPIDYRSIAEDLVRNVDHQVIRYVINEPSTSRMPYELETRETTYVEVKFCADVADGLYVAQLGEASWYFRRVPTQPIWRVCDLTAFVLDEIEDVLFRFDLRLPGLMF